MDYDEPVGYETLEEAARGDIPERFTSVVWCERQGDNAVVLLQVSTDPPYCDLTRCGLGPWGWVGEASGGASGTEQPKDFENWLATGEFDDW